MLYFERLQVGQNNYQLNEVSFKEAIKISYLKREWNEKRITEFLKYALKDDNLPLSMTTEERYYLAIKYSMSMAQNEAIYAPYLLRKDKPFQIEVTHKNIKVRSLTGRDAELLESKCDTIADWILGAMSLQMEILDQDIPKLHGLDCSEQELSESLISRSQAIQNLPDSTIDQYFSTYTEAVSQMESLVSIGFDNDGLILLGGTDDAPLRFRPTACFSELSRRLEQYLTEKSPAAE